MAPCLMTLGDPNCQNCFRFLLLVRDQLFQKFATDLREIFRIGSLLGNDDCYDVVTIAQGTLPWQPIFLYSIHTQIFSSQWPCVINSVQSSTTRSTVVKCNTWGRQRRFLSTTPIHCRGNGRQRDISLLDISSPETSAKKWKCCVDAREPTTDESHIINWRRRLG